MAGAISDFKELRVYRVAFDSSIRIFELSKQWPPEERYSLTDQIRRSSRAVCAHIAEAWFKKRYPRHFASKLSEASSEAGETVVWLDVARACGYVAEEVAADLEAAYRHIIGGLTRMIDQREKWCSSASSRVREGGIDYDDAL